MTSCGDQVLGTMMGIACVRRKLPDDMDSQTAKQLSRKEVCTIVFVYVHAFIAQTSACMCIIM